jgi:hypothetical protein
MSIYEKKLKEIYNKKQIDQSDYMYLWNNCINYNNGDIENFGETDLATILKCLDKANFKANSMVFAVSWEKSILLDKNFIPFVKKYEEKILKPISDLTGEIKRQEHISLIFVNACNITTQVLMYTLTQLKNEKFTNDEFYTKADIYRLFQGNILEFLYDIDKGTPAQQLECLYSIDRLMNEYPESRIALSRLCDLDESSTFIEMAIKAIKEVPMHEKQHFNSIIHNLLCYEYAKELESELINKNESNSNIKRIKV